MPFTKTNFHICSLAKNKRDDEIDQNGDEDKEIKCRMVPGEFAFQSDSMCRLVALDAPIRQRGALAHYQR